MSVGVGVLGAGWIAAAHVDGIRRVGGTRVVAMAATSAERARGRAAEMDIPRSYVGLEILEDPEVEVVHNATPTPLHAQTNAAIIAAGKHVVSDKPLTVTSAEAATLLEQARSAGIVHAVTFNHRGFRSVHQMRAMIADGAIGTLHAVRGAYLQGFLIDPAAGNWRVQETRIAGTLLDIGSHWFDLCEWVTGERLQSVMADLQQLVASRGGAEGGNVLLRFASGVRGACSISQAATGRGNRLTVEAYGSRGALVWSSQTPDELLRLPASGMSAETLFGDPGAIPGSAGLYSKAPARHPEAWLDAWRNILAPVYATINGQPTAGDYATFETGLRNARILEAVQRSHNEERWTEVSD